MRIFNGFVEKYNAFGFFAISLSYIRSLVAPPGMHYFFNGYALFLADYSRTPLIRPPSESHWCGRIRGMVAREGFVYEQKPLSVTRNVVI